MKNKNDIPKLIWKTPSEASPEAGQPVAPPPQVLRTREQIDLDVSKPKQTKGK